MPRKLNGQHMTDSDYSFNTTTKQLRIATWFAVGMSQAEIARKANTTASNVCHVLARADVKKHLVPLLRQYLEEAGRVVMGLGDGDDYLKGISTRTIARLLRIEKFDPGELCDKDGFPIPLNELPEDVRGCLKKFKLAKTVKRVVEVNGEKSVIDYPIWEYEPYVWDNHMRDLLGKLHIDTSKQAIEREKARIKEGDPVDIAEVDLGDEDEFKY